MVVELQMVVEMTAADLAEGPLGPVGRLVFRNAVFALDLQLAGLFQDAKLTKLSQQIFIDEKPDFYELANDTPKLTGEEAFAAFSQANGEDA